MSPNAEHRRSGCPARLPATPPVPSADSPLRIKRGPTLGFVGNTGTSGVPTDTNHHLHFEYRPGNVPVDPFPLELRDPDVVFEP